MDPIKAHNMLAAAVAFYTEALGETREGLEEAKLRVVQLGHALKGAASVPAADDALDELLSAVGRYLEEAENPVLSTRVLYEQLRSAWENWNEHKRVAGVEAGARTARPGQVRAPAVGSGGQHTISADGCDGMRAVRQAGPEALHERAGARGDLGVRSGTPSL